MKPLIATILILLFAWASAGYWGPPTGSAWPVGK